MSERKYKKKRSIIVSAAVAVFIVFCVAMLFSQLVTYLNLEKQMNEIEKKIYSAQEKIDELQADLDLPVDEDYVSRYGRKVLGLHLPEEVLFFSDIAQ